MAWDLIIRNGTVVDGTGMPSFKADIAVKDGKIGRIGRVKEPAKKEIEAEGLVVTPGFIDVHTHYDVQLDWDPLATPSIWHGVTTVLAGNCGFTLAPSKPDDVAWLAGMLSRVEGMSKAALAEGLKFKGGSFGDYWSRFNGKLGINVGSYVGHCAVRRYVMGDDASEREATADEVTAMQQLVREAMEQGAMGFSTSQLELHVGEDGRGVPSNHASASEILALCEVLAEFDRGVVEIIPRSFADGYDDVDRQLLRDIYRVSGRPIELNILLPTPQNPMAWEKTLEFVSEAAADGIRLHPQFTTNELGLFLKLDDTFVFDELPTWRRILTSPEPSRSEQLSDPAVRKIMKAEFDSPIERGVQFEWSRLLVQSVVDPSQQPLIGQSVAAIAEQQGKECLDVFLDISLVDNLTTEFTTDVDELAKEFIKHVVKTAIEHPHVMPGSSDGGAHLASFVGADYTTRLLTDWVPEVLSLEQAIWRNTLMPATVHGITDRGVLREGSAADILLIDMSRLEAGHAKLANDFPANTSRYVVEAEGYRAVIVNGEVVLEDNVATGALPGVVLKGTG